jgi:DNA-binding response OmpR family regulator
MPRKLPTNPFIIVAQDDRFYANVFRAKLTKEGFDVAVVENGEDALKAIRSRRPDLLLLDLILPVRDGFGVLKELRADRELKDLKVIVATNLSQEEDRQRAMAMGVLDYIVETNVSINEMVEKIKKYLP